MNWKPFVSIGAWTLCLWVCIGSGRLGGDRGFVPANDGGVFKRFQFNRRFWTFSY